MLAKFIFDWFCQNTYTYNENVAGQYIVGVDDGYVDCNKLAQAIDAVLAEDCLLPPDESDVVMEDKQIQLGAAITQANALLAKQKEVLDDR